MKGLCKDTGGVLKEQEGRGGRSSLEFGDSFDDGTSLVYVRGWIIQFQLTLFAR